MKKNASILFMTLLALSLSAQNAIKGSISDWNKGKGDVIVGMMEPTVIGSIDESGAFTIPLQPNFLDDVKKQIEEENKNSKNGWTSSLMTLEKVFGCYNDTLQVVNGDQPISKLTQMGAFRAVNIAEKKRLGYFFAANSQEFANTMMSVGSYNFQKGYYIDWYFVDEAGSVKGRCEEEAYALNQKEIYPRNTTYNVELKPGWNMVKYEITEIFTDNEGHTYPQETVYTTLDALPENTQYIFFED